MIGGFGHLRHFRLGLPIRLRVLFTFTARFLSTEQFVFFKTTIALITTRNKEATKKRRKERSLKEKNLGLETSNEDSFYEISYEMKFITNGFRSLQRRSKNFDSTHSFIYFKRRFV